MHSLKNCSRYSTKSNEFKDVCQCLLSISTAHQVTHSGSIKLFGFLCDGKMVVWNFILAHVWHTSLICNSWISYTRVLTFWLTHTFWYACTSFLSFCAQHPKWYNMNSLPWIAAYMKQYFHDALGQLIWYSLHSFVLQTVYLEKNMIMIKLWGNCVIVYISKVINVLWLK